MTQPAETKPTDTKQPENALVTLSSLLEQIESQYQASAFEEFHEKVRSGELLAVTLPATFKLKSPGGSRPKEVHDELVQQTPAVMQWTQEYGLHQRIKSLNKNTSGSVVFTEDEARQHFAAIAQRRREEARESAARAKSAGKGKKVSASKAAPSAEPDADAAP